MVPKYIGDMELLIGLPWYLVHKANIEDTIHNGKDYFYFPLP
jgi:hypothetical protein